ncbi:alpha/beta hydrolase [Streptomyces sp. NPDC090088]|uniref:alpha/beta hydrolase n=1 Tax=Streptomyces sp. NPDC090088 TaxID=3365944 RepID=UPI00382DD36D
MADEGVLDPWVADWLQQNSRQIPIKDIYLMARPTESPFPVTRALPHVDDEVVSGIPVRIYRGESRPTGLVVYFHGGGWCTGSIGLMDNVARELAHATGAVVVSVEYRLAPEHPFPAGLDDCETVTRWALANTARFDVPPSNVLIAGDSAGGNLAVALTLRLRGAAGVRLAGQVLIYPSVAAPTANFPSQKEFSGLNMAAEDAEWIWNAYSGGRDLADDPHAAPLAAESLADLPPAFIVLGGCDFLRDEGRAYAARLRDAGVDAEDVCFPGQIHGFMNHMFPAAADAFEQIGSWVRRRCDATDPRLP